MSMISPRTGSCAPGRSAHTRGPRSTAAPETSTSRRISTAASPSTTAAPRGTTTEANRGGGEPLAGSPLPGRSPTFAYTLKLPPVAPLPVPFTPVVVLCCRDGYAVFPSPPDRGRDPRGLGARRPLRFRRPHRRRACRRGRGGRRRPCRSGVGVVPARHDRAGGPLHHRPFRRATGATLAGRSFRAGQHLGWVRGPGPDDQRHAHARRPGL